MRAAGAQVRGIKCWEGMTLEKFPVFSQSLKMDGEEERDLTSKGLEELKTRIFGKYSHLPARRLPGWG